MSTEEEQLDFAACRWIATAEFDEAMRRPEMWDKARAEPEANLREKGVAPGLGLVKEILLRLLADMP